MRENEIQKIIEFNNAGFNAKQIMQIITIIDNKKEVEYKPIVHRAGKWVASLNHAPLRIHTALQVGKVQKLLENDKQITCTDIEKECGVARATANRIFHITHYRTPNTEIFKEGRKKYLVKRK